MSQHDYNIANQTFPATRTDLNNALGAVATNNSGNSAPSTTYANQWWFDSDGNTLYMRNKDNDAWVSILSIGATSDSVETIHCTSGDLTLDVAGDIILDGDGADVHFRDAGTGYLTIGNSSNDVVITSLQSDKDMIFKGVDGGSLITALTFDMSASGSATFNNNVQVNSTVIGASDLNLQSNDGNEKLTLDASGTQRFHVGGAEKMRLTTTGLGIGTSSPTRQLTVQNTIANAGGVIGLTSSDSSTSGTCGIIHFGNSTDSSIASINGIADGSTSAGALLFKTEADGGAIEERMRITSTGRLGFNNSSPADTIHFKSSGSPSGDIRLILEGAATDANCTIDFRNSASTYKGGILYDTDDNNFKFFTNGSNQRMVIKSSGTFGFGRTESQTAQNSFAHFYGGEHSYFAFKFENAETATNSYTMLVQNNYAADDNSSEFFRCQDGGAARLIIYSDGDIQNHDNAYGAISDERIKQDIRDSNSQWDDIKAVRVRNFKKKDDVRQYGDDAWEQIGVVAQELEAVSPKLVRQGDPTASDILSDSSFGTLWTADDPETQDGVEDILYTADDIETQDILYTADDELPEGVKIGDVKTQASHNVGDVKIQGKQSTEKIGDVKEVKEQVKSVNYSILYMKAVKALQEAMDRIETLESKVATLEGE